jgi:hypothetical protein
MPRSPRSLVEPALNDEPEQSRSRGVSVSNRTRMLATSARSRACLAIASQRAMDDVEQGLVAERLLEEIDRTGLDRAHARGHVGVTADENDRDLMSRPDEAFLELEAARTR